MSLFPNDDLLAKEIESWKPFAESLRKEDKEVFNKMIHQCYKHIKSINLKGEPYTTEALLMSLILTQHKMIDFLLSSRK